MYSFRGRVGDYFGVGLYVGFVRGAECQRAILEVPFVKPLIDNPERRFSSRKEKEVEKQRRSQNEWDSAEAKCGDGMWFH
ncbi:MAG: hypothetical protein CMO55_05595 [Verrucomicrobiales bacterium]|nr:hypothetical protein [Verrucomicrobiales bacterium]